MNEENSVRDRCRGHVLQNYGRLDIELVRGEGVRVWDREGRPYLDMGAGIAVCSLGHCHPALVGAIARQSEVLVHVSNLYHQELQGRLAERLCRDIGPGRCFFCNSGAEANEALFKLARRVGHESGRYEILTTHGSFHGRTLAGISATGQQKVKEGFGPLVPGFRQVPFNDLEAMAAAISPSTIAVLIEGIQGEGGIHAARPGYLTGLRSLCDRHGLLLLLDGVQCGHYRTGRFQSYQRILEDTPGRDAFLPDALAMAKSLGGGFPLGAVWIGERHAGALGPGSHGSTFGGNPLACAAGLAVLDEIESAGLADNARRTGEQLRSSLLGLQERCRSLIREVRGLGLMIGIEFEPDLLGLVGKPPLSLRMESELRRDGLLVIPAGTRTLRMLPPLNLTAGEADEAVTLLEGTLERIAR